MNHLARRAAGRGLTARSALLRTLALAALLLAGPAQAAVNCTVTVGGVAFGAYDPLATLADDSTGMVTVTCTHVGQGGGVTRVNYSVALSTGASGSYAQRYMQSGTPRLNYNLYRDAARTVVWGNGGGGTSLITGSVTVGPGVGNGTRITTYTVYGRAPALQDASPGAYLDSIVITLTY